MSAEGLPPPVVGGRTDSGATGFGVAGRMGGIYVDVLRAVTAPVSITIRGVSPWNANRRLKLAVPDDSALRSGLRQVQSTKPETVHSPGERPQSALRLFRTTEYDRDGQRAVNAAFCDMMRVLGVALP